MSWTRAILGAAALLALLLVVGQRKSERRTAQPEPVATAQSEAFTALNRTPPNTETPPAAPPPPVAGQDLFAGPTVIELALEVPPSGIQSLRDQPRVWTSARLRTGNEIFEAVAVHIKGSQGSLQSIDQRPSFTISFSHFQPDRRFHQLRKIHLNNCAEDPSAMTQILCGELCRNAGLPAARSSYAILRLNRRKLGLYVLTEGLTKEFLQQHFTKTRGNLYDGGFRKDIDQTLERIGGEGVDTQNDRRALLRAARERDPRRRWARLTQVLDTERFISLLAITTLTWNWDGYPMAQNNYRLYHDPASDRMVFIPHGLDQMFWEPQGSIYPPLRGLVAAAVMETAEGQTLYRKRLAELHRDVFQVSSLHRRIDELTAHIAPYRRDAPQQGARLKSLVAARARSVAGQLAEGE